uniref:Uncharacterized protein n=1 Tax=Suricata suricatta TaxID=37032 RepID=A0A673V781_SURSU
MQWFTEFMELFLSVWNLIKNLESLLCGSLRRPGCSHMFPRRPGAPVLRAGGFCQDMQRQEGSAGRRAPGLSRVGDAVRSQQALESPDLLRHFLMRLQQNRLKKKKGSAVAQHWGGGGGPGRPRPSYLPAGLQALEHQALSTSFLHGVTLFPGP